MKHINDNGSLRPEDACIYGAESPAALYGDGLFETIRFVSGKMPLWGDHWTRLSAGCKALLIALPAVWNADFFQDEIGRTVATAARQRECRVRLHVYAAGDGKARYVISCEPMPARMEHITLGISTIATKEPGLLAHLKTCNALPYRVAAREATAMGWDEAVLLNSEKQVVEATKSNILLSRGGIVFANTPADGCIAGVMRARLLEWMQEWGLPVKKSSLTLDALYAADEIFLTNALRGVMPVRRLFSHNDFGERELPTTLGARLARMVEQKFIALSR